MWREEGCTKTEKGFLHFLPSDGTRFGGASADAAESYRAGTEVFILLEEKHSKLHLHLALTLANILC